MIAPLSPPRFAAAALTVLVLTGCTADDAGAGPATASPPAASVAPGTPLPGSTPPGTPSRTPDLASAEEIATGIEVPWGLTFLPGGDALVTERGTGRILRVGPGGREPELVREIPGVVTLTEGGLLGLALSPAFAQDNRVYAYYTTADDARIARFRLDGTDAPEVLLALPRGRGHSGGRLAFGPDRMLYATVGDGTSSDRAQDMSSLSGKILRLTPDGDPAPGNPVEGSPVYSLGHRNPQGIAWDAEGRMYAAEFGQDAVDEINLIQAGHNYGWPVVEGIGDTRNGRFTNPLLTWTTAEASPSGIAIAGDTLYVAALRGERLWTVPLTGGGRLGQPAAELTGRYGRLRTVEVAPDGALWLTTSNRQRSGAPRDGDDRILRFPAR